MQDRAARHPGGADTTLEGPSARPPHGAARCQHPRQPCPKRAPSCCHSWRSGQSTSNPLESITLDPVRRTSESGALYHGRHLAPLAGDHGLRVPVGAGRTCVRARAVARSRSLPRLVELRVHRRRRVDQRGRSARPDAEGLLLGRDQEPPWNCGGGPGYVDVAPRRPPAHVRQPAAAREPQGEEADLAPAPPAGVPAEDIHAVPGSPRLPVT